MQRCTSTTKAGKPCRARPMRGRDVCKAHTGDEDVGQRTKLSAETTSSIAGYMRRGVPAKYAAQAAGVSESAFYAWQERGEADLEQGAESLQAEFVESIARARAEFIASTALVVSKHAVGWKVTDADGVELTVSEGDWRAAAWLLERRGGDDWREKVGVEHGGEVRTTPVEVPADEERLRVVGAHLREIGAIPDVPPSDEVASSNGSEAS